MKEKKIIEGKNLDGIIIRFEENKNHFLYFIKNHLGNIEVSNLNNLARNRNQPKLFARLSRIRNTLPNTIYNINNNPKGWREFLEVIED